MNFRIIDSHAHAQFPAYDADRDVVIARALGKGIGMVNVGTQYSTSRAAIDLARQHPEGVWATVGFHPNHLDPRAHHDRQELALRNAERFEPEKFLALARGEGVVAVGECGLDYFRSGIETKDAQAEAFERQIAVAADVGKPLVIHCRQAFDDLIAILSANRARLSAPAGVVHFFSGSWEDAGRLMDLGFFLGFGGVVTFARDYDDIVKRAPLERILLETDAPYVSPAPYRGQRNEPAYVTETAQKIAELRSIPFDELIGRTTENARTLFRI